MTTAAVPQAKSSVTLPEPTPSSNSSMPIRRSTGVSPNSAAKVKIESRVTPSRMDPVSSGVMSSWSRGNQIDVHATKLLQPAVLRGVCKHHLVTSLARPPPAGRSDLRHSSRRISPRPYHQAPHENRSVEIQMLTGFTPEAK